jgi:asparagine synthase (glutamine-hydrolysing)
MGAQAGIWNFDGEQVSQEFLARISEAVAEYGPDGETTYLEDALGMVYRPYCTTAESHLERQPFRSKSGKVITWDGRLDNRDELKKQLPHRSTSDDTDVALVAAAFDRWGADCFARLLGDWAIVIWDPLRKELLLSRDYIGVKHLFYYVTPTRIVWCSHLAPLAVSKGQLSLSAEYIATYFAYWPEAHLTPFSEILSVPPGKVARVHNGHVDCTSYWTFNPHSKIRYKTDAEYEEHFFHLFRQSVRRRLRSDSPILADLSGGLDSTSIVCMTDDILAKEGAEAPSLDTFSFCDRAEPDESDYLYFTKVEEQRGRPGFHAEIQGVGDTFLLDNPRSVATPGFGVRAELKAAKTDVVRRGKYRVLLSGTGGDQVMAQGIDPRVQLADLFIQLRLLEFVKGLVVWSLFYKRPLIQFMFQSVVMSLPTSIRARLTTVATVAPWVNRTFARRHGVTDHLLPAAEGSWRWLPSIRHFFQMLVQLAGQMTNTPPALQETRYPFLDRMLFEYMISIPTDQLHRPGQRRSLTRRALRSILPRDVLTRRTKSCSGRCDIVTIEKHLDKIEAMLQSPLSARLGYLDQTHFHTALLTLKNGKIPRHLQPLLKALSLEFWIRDLADRGVIAVSSLIGRDSSTASARLTPHQNFSGE